MNNWDDLISAIEREARAEARRQSVLEPQAFDSNIPIVPDDEGWFSRADFIGLDATRFLGIAYRVILGRSVDTHGKTVYGPWCDSWAGRVAVLGVLAQSDEAAARGVNIKGVRLWAFLWQQSGRLPISVRRWWQWALNRWLCRADATDFAQQALNHAQLLAQRGIDVTALKERVSLLEKAALQQDVNVGRNIHSEQTEGSRQAVLDPAVFDDFYLAFEDACRGDDAAISEKQIRYVSLLTALGEKPVVDIGCGRGEWLALLKQHGFAAQGVDMSPAMVARCEQRGIAAVCANGLFWLREQDDNAFSAITAFHVLEHLPFDALLALVLESARVVASGGRVIFETPNPENVLVGSHTFYHDPTHRNPLTPTLLSFVLQFAGFKEIEVIRTNPYPADAQVAGDDALTQRVNGHFTGPQDFAVTGVKP